MKVAILFICTGKYDIFWKDFYKSSEKYFLINDTKEYFVFTTSTKIISLQNDHIHVIPQEKLGWPYDTLMRFQMFDRIADKLIAFEYIFFVNANMRFLVPVNHEILPTDEEGGLMAVKHPGFFAKINLEFSYDRNPQSTAYIPLGQGKYYFMGGFNGGKAKEYLKLIKSLKNNIDIDLSNKTMAVWHDESHLNNYFLTNTCKVLDPSYGFPEGWDIPFKAKIIILDKNKLGGHDFLRGLEKPNLFKKIKHLFKIR